MSDGQKLLPILGAPIQAVSGKSISLCLKNLESKLKKFGHFLASGGQPIVGISLKKLYRRFLTNANVFASILYSRICCRFRQKVNLRVNLVELE